MRRGRRHLFKLKLFSMSSSSSLRRNWAHDIFDYEDHCRDFEKGIVWIKWIGTHKDYDRIDVKEVRHGG